MSNRGSNSLSSLNTVIFKNAATASIPRKFLSLFPGLGYAAGYKVAQRVYKFGGQPYFRDLIDGNAGGFFRESFGKKWGGMLMHATAGRYVLVISETRAYTDVVLRQPVWGNREGLGVVFTWHGKTIACAVRHCVAGDSQGGLVIRAAVWGSRRGSYLAVPSQSHRHSKYSPRTMGATDITV
jgi:hypothetical protein